MDTKELRRLIAKVQALQTLGNSEEYTKGVGDSLEVLQKELKTRETEQQIIALQEQLQTLKASLEIDKPVSSGNGDIKPKGKRGRKSKAEKQALNQVQERLLST